MSTPSIELQTLRESQDRALHREGIPMFVVLADERGAGNTTSSPERGATPEMKTPGSILAPDADEAVLARLDHYRARLAAHQRDGDMGVLGSVLMVAAYEDFDRSVSP